MWLKRFRHIKIDKQLGNRAFKCLELKDTFDKTTDMHVAIAVQPSCLKGRVVCGTVYGEMHLKDLLGSLVRVGYRIPFPDFYLVLHGLRCR